MNRDYQAEELQRREQLKAAGEATGELLDRLDREREELQRQEQIRLLKLCALHEDEEIALLERLIASRQAD